MYLKNLLLVIFTGLVFTTMAQKSKDYSTNWSKVAAFEIKGLTRSALKEVLVIYKLAVKDNNDAQQIKAAIYQVKYHNMVQEDSRENNIFYVDTLINQAKAPARNILQSMQAEMYWQYLQNNRYKFYSRKPLSDEKATDISTWSLEKLHANIGKLYKASLSDKDLLQTSKIEVFDPIIIKGENTRQLRPTLFDFLAFRALDYFKNDEQDLIKPAYKFTINNPAAFAPAAEFIATTFSTKDTSALHFKAVELLQEIIRFHLKDKNPDALLDADLIRLNFMHQYAINENKNDLYEAALKNIETTYTGNDAAAQAMYLRAQIYREKGQQYDPFTATINQYEIKRAKELCGLAIAKYPKSEGGINAQNLLNEILQPALTLTTEKVNIPEAPFRTLVNYKNTSTVYFRVIKTTVDAVKKMDRRDYDKLWKDIVALKATKTWSVSLPDLNDYQTHAAEIKVDGLPGGVYLILASLDKNFSLQKNIIAKQLTYVSNISYINNNKDEYYVLNRDNGQPYNNASVQVWETKYNYSSGGNDDTKAESYTTDKNGFFQLKKSKDYRNIKLQIKTANDELFLQDETYNTYYNGYEQTPVVKPVTFLFTDRSIYRPGQTVYFKGIVLQKGVKATETSILPKFSTSLQLRDANQQKVTDVQLVTNEYGSYHGSFKLPEGTLNGQFNLFDTATLSQQYFSVEEYKRPKFFTEVEKPKGTYRLMDSIAVTGTAKAYAGNNIDAAKVKYRVVRKVRYPIWWGWGSYIRKGRPGIPYGRSDEMEITNGETTTDAAGAFHITFEALPDESIDKKTQPIFYYEVSADVTDLNGETRSGSASVAVAYQMLQLDINVADKMSTDSLKNIFVKSTNLNDIEETTNATVTIQELKTPAKIFRERYWDQPDQFVMSRNEYYGYFPYDVYKNENEVKNYEAAAKVFEKTDSTNHNVALAGLSLKPGWYKIVAVAKDKYGEEVKTEKYVQLFSNNKAAITANAVEVRVDNNQSEPGKKIQYNIATGFKNIWLIHTLTKMEEGTKTAYPTITSGQPFQNEILVTEKDRGGMNVSYAFVQHNRVYKGNESFYIPWSNKELSIDYASFRDKLLPGSEEKWTVKISGNKGEKVAAEMLAAMYDASLDQFKPHSWSALNIWPGLYNKINWTDNGFEEMNSEEYNRVGNEYVSNRPKSYDQLLYSNNNMIYAGGSLRSDMVLRSAAPGVSPVLAEAEMSAAPKQFKNAQVMDSAKAMIDVEQANGQVELPINNKAEIQPQIRKNFNETAFFFPDLQTDADGNVTFSFTIPEALTKWKLMTFAHTKTLASGYAEKTTVTQKPLMIQPNAPRFLREGDGIEFSAKVVNLTDKEITGTTQLELLDATTNQPVDGWFKNIFPTQYFTVAAGQSAAVKFPIEIPFNFNSAMTYRIVAKSSDKSASQGGNFSDGEEMAIPVLTNRMLVTETMPLNLRNTTSKTFKFEKLLNSGSSQTLTNHALTMEYTANPAWYAVQALPYLMEYPYECAEQTFNRYYANTLASFVSNSAPKIKAVFDKWRSIDTTALQSNLQKNEELKSALLQETPWVLAAKNETDQKKNIALLFDLVKMGNETTKAIQQLKDMQSTNGGFVWFKGGADDRYITQYILTGIGHLKKINALPGNNNSQVKDISMMVNKALPYLDKKIKADYDALVKLKVDLKKNNLSNTAIQYLYMRSFFTETPVAATSQTAYTYYREQAKKYWISNGKYLQAMIALALNRTNDGVTPKAIIQSLKENAINKEEMGMYWKEWTNGGYYWYQAPIESQALMIEAFSDIDKNTATVDDLKTWLLKQKQTQNWKTTKATAEACYALLLNGNNWLNTEREIAISLGNTVIKSTDDKTEDGTGYFKKIIEGEKVNAVMGNIKVDIKSANAQKPSLKSKEASWGSVYWQYFEDLDKITFAETPLKLTKKLFIEKNTDKGPVLEAIADNAELKIGDKVIVRIELKVDRDMEYVHMKDMRAACMEPVNVISQFKWQAGLGYYESPKDASANFFFSWLPRGSYVFEYPLFVTHAGNFSNGITSIQCMYAPEFTSHSEGIRVKVEAQ
ncbi:alpha-2-macroglobulin family protein [Ferruginibacter paludis]|uniref:alpha-2-macroglobulin family protein n=1 Tax=Ferruginibacter paludis TaxID=1310417 RepID=UPI0025B5B098|nr:alpha-2-macroglobulin family protein [Ferruginibacter paludis]MDN3654744.1 alpha-2-macroglobulin family protein [Ferruginibacter paludis]